MAYSFQKCCFDSEKVGLVKECDRMSCILNGSHSFDFFFIETSMKVFILLTENSWRRGGVLALCRRRLTFCPDHSDKCSVCKEFALVFENLQDAYFFSPNKDKHQPVMWKVFFEHGYKLR